tara:strand:- start:14995 stop:15156 length:162 start_codon:yes stop_codon:yes gene_type:complete
VSINAFLTGCFLPETGKKIFPSIELILTVFNTAIFVDYRQVKLFPAILESGKS